MTTLKPKNAKTAEAYISQLPEPRKTEIQNIYDFIRKIAPELMPHIQSNMIGFGSYHYKYASEREGDWPIIALASQKNYISIYVCASDGKEYIAEKYKDKLKPASVGKSCIRYKSFDDIDFDALKFVLKKGIIYA